MQLTTAQRLEQAQSARHKLLTGSLLRVFMDQNGERVEYTATNIAQLDKYIAELSAELAPSLAALRRPRPIGFTF